MIRLDRLTKSFRLRGERRVVIDDVSLTVPTGRAVALLGHNGAGKSTLLRLIAGTMEPDSGRVTSDGTISWPVGFSGSFHPDLTGAQNTLFIGRIYGIDTGSLTAFVQDFCELGRFFDMPVRAYSSGMRARLAFGVSMGIPFDTYLVDEVTAVGDAVFRRKSKAVFRERMRNASAIVVNHNMDQVREICDAGMVLDRGRVRWFDDLGEAIACHRELMGEGAD